jgi:hypothetical protein
MNRLRRVVVLVSLIFAVSSGCSQSAPPEPGPSSSLLPAVTLPAGSTLEESKATSAGGPTTIETWNVPLSFAQVKALLREQLPIGRSFAGAPYKSEDAGVDKAGNEQISWNWADGDSMNPPMVDVAARATQDGQTRVIIGLFT